MKEAYKALLEIEQAAKRAGAYVGPALPTHHYHDLTYQT